MNNKIKEMTEVIQIVQGCGRKGLENGEVKIVQNEKIATALCKAGYRKQSDTVKEFAEKFKERCNEELQLLAWEYGEGAMAVINIFNKLAAEYSVEVEK